VGYAALEDRQRRLAHLEHALAMLTWDEAVMMPAGSGESRAEALAGLGGLRHQLATAPEIGDWIAAAREEDLDAWRRANLREIEREYRRATCLPVDLVEAAALASTRCEQAWRRLRPANDWAGLAPLLGEVVARQRECAAALAERLGLSPYDALLDGYEPGVRSAQVEPLFRELRDFLPAFTQRVLERQRSEPVVRPRGPFDREAQRALGARLMRAVGFDAERGRLDVSHHPFCGGVPHDVRITTRYDDDDFLKALMGVLHETGHAKYEQGLPADWLTQPVGRARSMAFHESQSLLLEMQIARGRPFLEFAVGPIREALAGPAAAQPEAFTLDNLHRLVTRVEPGAIRVDADEVTYPSHVILRFELERDLMEGRCEVADLPERWDVEMDAVLGIDTRGDYANGVLQDVHWPAGLFGYFPTYTLGALLAAQLRVAAGRALPDLEADLRGGRFQTLDGWLREQLWSQGSRLEGPELCRRTTAAPLGTSAFVEHLRSRYDP